jgi:hypothetical protein
LGGKDFFDPDTCPRKHIDQGIDAEKIDLPFEKIADARLSYPERF